VTDETRTIPVTPVHFGHSPISFECPVPVDSLGQIERGGEIIPLAERTAKCGAPANFSIGSQLVCEAHLRHACGLMGLDAEDIIRELREG